jgi:hypothetical protein
MPIMCLELACGIYLDAPKLLALGILNLIKDHLQIISRERKLKITLEL